MRFGVSEGSVTDMQLSQLIYQSWRKVFCRPWQINKDKLQFRRVIVTIKTTRLAKILIKRGQFKVYVG